MEKFRQKVKELAKATKTYVKSMDTLIGEINSLMRGYTSYFNHTNATLEYKNLYRLVG